MTQFEPWEMERAVWNDLAAKRLLRSLDLPDPDHLARKGSLLNLEATQIAEQYGNFNRKESRWEWGNVQMLSRHNDLLGQVRLYTAQATLVRELGDGRWSLLMGGYYAEAYMGLDIDREAFRAAVAAAGDEHEQAVCRAVDEGKPVPRWNLRQYGLLDRIQQPS